MSLPDLLPVFPLPNIVFYPGSVLPLHVFEPRYRALVQHCLAHELPIGVPRIRAAHEEQHLGEPPLHEVCGVGRIERHLELPDGRFNLVLRAFTRLRLEEEAALDAGGFRLFRVSEQPDLEIAPAVQARHMGAIAALARGLATTVPALGHLLDELMKREMPPGQIADQIVDFTTLSVDEKQAFLELRDPAQRLEKAEALLADLLATSVHDHGHHGHHH